MNILSIDTTTKTANVAVKKGDEIYYSQIDNEITHSEKLLPLVDKCLNTMNLSIKDIDKFACLNGPGSFTGIRIGLCTIKAFSQVSDKEIFSISSLDMLCIKAFITNNLNKTHSPCYVSSLIDAKNDRVYFKTLKIWLNESNKIEFETIHESTNILFDEALNSITDLLNISSISYIIAGDNITKNESRFSDLKDKVTLANIYPTSKDVIDALYFLENISCFTYTSYSLDAIYARMSQAERVKNER